MISYRKRSPLYGEAAVVDVCMPQVSHDSARCPLSSEELGSTHSGSCDNNLGVPQSRIYVASQRCSLIYRSPPYALDGAPRSARSRSVQTSDAAALNLLRQVMGCAEGGQSALVDEPTKVHHIRANVTTFYINNVVFVKH